jgi:Skp family chaperone for outer membrane proteins
MFSPNLFKVPFEEEKMKTNILLALALSLTFATAHAQSEEQVLNSDPIDVDGYLQERKVTDQELEQIKSEIRKQKTESHLNKEKTKGFKELSRTTEKLSETTEEYLDEKKDAQKEIAEYNKKIKCLMEENPGVECDKYIRNRREEVVAAPAPAPVVQEVAVAQAAPAAVSAVEAPESDSMSDEPFETIKMLVEGGVTNYSGEEESLTADAAGLRIESNINSRFSMGFGINYAQLTTEDYANNSFDYSYSNSYYNDYGSQGREITYGKFGFDVNGKFFITQGRRFRPFIGLGLGYNMATLKYKNNNEQRYFDPMGGNFNNFGDEEYKANFATGTVMLGTEIMITKMIGLNLTGTFAKGLGMSGENAKNRSNNPDQRRLGELADDIVNSTSLSMFAGLVFVF